MSRDMCADVKMEEGYMRMSIEYNNDISKNKIEENISKAEKELNLYPSVIRRSISDTAGNFSVEFEHDGCSRECGEFYELILKRLEINCQV